MTFVSVNDNTIQLINQSSDSSNTCIYLPDETIVSGNSSTLLGLSSNGTSTAMSIPSAPQINSILETDSNKSIVVNNFNNPDIHYAFSNNGYRIVGIDNLEKYIITLNCDRNGNFGTITNWIPNAVYIFELAGFAPITSTSAIEDNGRHIVFYNGDTEIISFPCLNYKCESMINFVSAPMVTKIVCTKVTRGTLTLSITLIPLF